MHGLEMDLTTLSYRETNPTLPKCTVHGDEPLVRHHSPKWPTENDVRTPQREIIIVEIACVCIE